MVLEVSDSMLLNQNSSPYFQALGCYPKESPTAILGGEPHFTLEHCESIPWWHHHHGEYISSWMPLPAKKKSSTNHYHLTASGIFCCVFVTNFIFLWIMSRWAFVILYLVCQMLFNLFVKPWCLAFQPVFWNKTFLVINC